MREYTGDFEVHITVQTANHLLLDRFRDWCGEQGFKCVRIVLARGEHTEQPMATWRCRATHLPAAVEEAQGHATDLAHIGIPVVRVKVEAAPDNAEVPVRDADAVDHEPENYFEHHIKVRRSTLASRDRLFGVCEEHGAHLSRNAFRQPAQGEEERFVTLRSYGVGRRTSEQQLQRLLLALHELGEQIVEHESEYCVYDSNLNLDAGWLPASA